MTASQPPQPPQGGRPEHGHPHQQPPQGPPPGYGQYGQQPPPGYGPPPAYGQQPPPGYGVPPAYGQQPPPGYGVPPAYGQQPPPGYGPPSGYGPPPGYPAGYGPPQPYGQPATGAAGFSFDPKRLKVTDYVISAATLLFFVLAFFPWFTLGDDFFGFSLSGFDSSNVTSAFVLFLLATAWAVLPAFVDLRLSFPRSWITVGLATLGWLLTLFAWLESFDGEFSIWALLGFLTATAILLLAVLSLVPEVRNRPALQGGPADAAQWASQPAPDVSRPQQPYGQPAQPYGQPAQPYGQRTESYGQPAESYGQPQQQYSPPPPTPAPPPPPSGGSTASGEGSTTTGSGERPIA
jgi:hypothetical protein